MSMMNVLYLCILAANYDQKHLENSKIGLENCWICFLLKEWETCYMLSLLWSIIVICGLHLLQWKSFKREVISIFDDIQNESSSGRHQSSYYPHDGIPRGRVYVSGWAPRIERSDAHRQSTIHDTGVGLARSVVYQPTAAGRADGSSYAAVKARCQQTGTLWEDPDFPPVARSLYYRRPPSAWPNIQWKRPHVSSSHML